MLASSLAAVFAVGPFIGFKKKLVFAFLSVHKLPSAAPNVPPGRKIEKVSSWSFVFKTLLFVFGGAQQELFMLFRIF